MKLNGREPNKVEKYTMCLGMILFVANYFIISGNLYEISPVVTVAVFIVSMVVASYVLYFNVRY